jgi:hypothetical protein
MAAGLQTFSSNIYSRVCFGGMFQGRDWPVVFEKVMSAVCPRAGYGCTVATVYYEYRVGGENYAAAFERPFLWHDSGVEHAAKFTKGTKFKVRVKPEDPSKAGPCD